MRVKLNFHDSESTVNTDITLETTTQNSIELIPIGKSGIHIKKKNRGSFTSYCGGKVTDECIRRAKNSPSAAIRKKAVFAQNARGWAKKHQEGGTLDHTPGVPKTFSTDLNKTFVSLDVDAPTFAQNNPDLFQDRYKLNLPSTHFEDTKPIEGEEVTNPSTPEWMKKPYIGIGEAAKPTQVQRSTVASSTTRGTFGTGASSSLMSAVNQFLGIPYQLGGSGPERNQGLDCSGFVSRVIGAMGSNLHGNCRTLWDGTSRINTSDLKPGDLIFLQDTQPGKVAHGKASHVAIVTDTSKLAEGKVGVAHSGRTGTKSNMTEWDLNNGYYAKHLLGAGRLVQNAKFGGKIDYSDAHE